KGALRPITEIALGTISEVFFRAIGKTAAGRLVAKAALGAILETALAARTASGLISKIAGRPLAEIALGAITERLATLGAIRAVAPLGPGGGLAEAAGRLVVAVMARAARPLGLVGFRRAAVIVE